MLPGYSEASVDPGATFVVACAINANDGTMRHPGQQLTAAAGTFPFVNGATGPIEVRGSKAGDMLKVEIVNMELDKLGFTPIGRVVKLMSCRSLRQFPRWSL